MALPIILFPLTPLSSFSGLLVPEFAESEGAGDQARMEYIASRALERTLSYAVATAVFICLFAEELGYVIYSSYDAGYFISLLAPIVPIMYLDHVTDAMLKGIGEQVFSMWVNIADSLISVILVVVLIPIFDIQGYAIVIIVMELFNFTLSYLRLKRRISFRLNMKSSLLLPLLIALASATLTSRLFFESGAVTDAVRLAMKIVFAICVYISLEITVAKIREAKVKKLEKSKI